MILTEVKRLRQWHPNLGKEKVFAKLVPFCQKHRLPLPSVSTIGRMIGSVQGKMRTSAYRMNSKGQRRSISKEKVTRKPKGLALKPLECLAFDSIVRQRQGMKRFILTSIDPVAHIAFAYAPPSGASGHAAKFHEAITENFPDLAHPKTPKMNAHCERFNRTIQESFVDYHEDLLFTDLALFNEKMSDWLIF